MGIIEMNGGQVTTRYLMNKTKEDLAGEYLQVLGAIDRLRNRLAQYESQCIPRTADMPERAFLWEKTRHGLTTYWYWADAGGFHHADAADLLPDEPGPVFRYIVDVE